MAGGQYVDAFGRSDFEAMLNYYKANYPMEPYQEDPFPVVRVKCPVLMMHGLKAPYLLAGALNDTWNWLDNDLTLVAIPDAGHFVQHDAAELVTRTMTMWLGRSEPAGDQWAPQLFRMRYFLILNNSTLFAWER